MGDILSQNVNPLAFALLAAASGVVLFSSRKNAMIAFLLMALLMPLGQQFVVLGLHFRFMRILILVGACRVVFRREMREFVFTRVDKLVFFWALVGVICGIIRGPKAETFGVAYDALGIFFFFRVLLVDAKNALDHLRVLAIAGVIVAVSMSYELITHRNPLYVFGGVPEITLEREGRFRCQGPFRHPILAGTYAATLFPLLVGLWFQGGRVNKRLAFLGLAASSFSACVAASSGALLTLVGAASGLALWPMRNRMYLFRRIAIAAIVGLIFVMNAPVWYLIAKISDYTGGTGWHRSFLIDLAIRHFGDWWLVGYSYTVRWAPPSWQDAPGIMIGPDSLDITNHYIMQGLSGGLLGLGLFLAIIVSCFRILGHSLRTQNDSSLEPKLKWALGVSLAAHCTAFMSVSYFDQIQVFWFWLLAVISILSVQRPRMPELQGEPAQFADERETPATAVPFQPPLGEPWSNASGRPADHEESIWTIRPTVVRTFLGLLLHSPKRDDTPMGRSLAAHT
jgi:hypothetical protein